jgi:hypothetical protein
MVARNIPTKKKRGIMWKIQRAWRFHVRFRIGIWCMRAAAWLCMLDGKKTPYLVASSLPGWPDEASMMVMGRGKEVFVEDQGYGCLIQHSEDTKLFWCIAPEGNWLTHEQP